MQKYIHPGRFTKKIVNAQNDCDCNINFWINGFI